MPRRRRLFVRVGLLALVLLAVWLYARSRYASAIYIPYPAGGKRLFCDLNADGDIDIITTRSHYPLSTETVYWQYWRRHRWIRESLPINQVLFATDLFLVGKDEKGQVVVISGKQGGICKNVLLETSQVPPGAIKARGGDLDRDGQCDDVVVIPRSGQELRWFKRRSGGSWRCVASAELPLSDRGHGYSFVDEQRAPFLTVQVYPLLNAWNVTLWEGKVRFLPRRTLGGNLQSAGLLRYDFDGDRTADRLLVHVQEDRGSGLPVSLATELESTRHGQMISATIAEQGWYLCWASFSERRYEVPLVVIWRNLQGNCRICEYTWNRDAGWTVKRQMQMRLDVKDEPYVRLVYADGDGEADLMMQRCSGKTTPYPVESLLVARGASYQMVDWKKLRRVSSIFLLPGEAGYCQIGKRLWIVAQRKPTLRGTGALGDLCFLNPDLQLQRGAGLSRGTIAVLPSADGRRVYIGTEWVFKPPQIGAYRLPLGTYRGFVLTVCEGDRCSSARFTLPVKDACEIESVSLGGPYHEFPAEPSVMRLAGKQRIYVEWKHGDILLVAFE